MGVGGRGAQLQEGQRNWRPGTTERGGEWRTCRMCVCPCVCACVCIYVHAHRVSEGKEGFQENPGTLPRGSETRRNHLEDRNNTA